MKNTWTKPKYTVVLDLGRGSIKLAAAETAGEAARFRGITQIQLPRDAAGQARFDEFDIAKRIGVEVKCRGWSEMPAACLLAGSSTSTQSFLFPPMPDVDLRQAIELKLAETLHFDIEDACFDFRRIREYESEGSTQVLVLVVAARREAVDRGVRIMRNAGLTPTAVGASSESLANLMYYASLSEENDATIHADIGSHSTILNLFEGRLLRFSREIDVAGATFTEALMRPIITARGPVELSRQQAEEVKLAAGYPMDLDGNGPQPTLPHGVQMLEILPLLEPVAQRLATELKRSIDYLRGILDRGCIDRIVLSGPAAAMRNLGVFLEESLETKVLCLDPVARAMAHWRLAICDKDIPSTAGFSAILGYSLGNHRPINLLPSEARYRTIVQRVSKVRRAVTPSALAFAICLALLAIPVQDTYGTADKLMRWYSSELDQRVRTESLLSENLAQARRQMQRVATARGSVPNWTGIMKEFSTILPEEVQITSLESKREGRTSSILLEARVHSGGIPSGMTIIELSQILGDSPFFSDLHVFNARAGKRDGAGEFEASLEILGTPYDFTGGSQ